MENTRASVRSPVESNDKSELRWVQLRIDLHTVFATSLSRPTISFHLGERTREQRFSPGGLQRIGPKSKSSISFLQSQND